MQSTLGGPEVVENDTELTVKDTVKMDFKE